MIQVYVEGMSSCKVINVDVNYISEIRIGSLIELDSQDLGAGIERFLVSNVCMQEEKISVSPYRKSIIRAYPTSNDRIYK